MAVIRISCFLRRVFLARFSGSRFQPCCYQRAHKYDAGATSLQDVVRG